MQKRGFNFNKSIYLLAGFIVFLVLGIAVMFLGALSHINPNVNFAALFTKEPMMKLVYSIVGIAW